MYSFNRFVEGDVLTSPFMPKKKCILTMAGATLGSGIISGASSLFGGLLGSSAQDKANAMNLKIAQMNNEFNERMLDKQMDYNTTMWNKQNQYNTPAAQAARYQQAGLNPYLMMSQGGTAGSATSANGVNPPTASEVGVQQPNMAMAEAFDNAGRNAVLAGQQAAQLISNLEVNKSVINKNKADSAKSLADAKRTNELTPYEKRQLGALINNLNEQSATQRSIQKLTDQQTRTEFYETSLKQIQTQLANKELQGWDEKRKLELANLIADTRLKYAQGKLSYAQAFQAIQNGYMSIALTKTENATRSSKVSQSFWDARQSKFNASKLSWEALNAQETSPYVIQNSYQNRYGSGSFSDIINSAERIYEGYQPFYNR